MPLTKRSISPVAVSINRLPRGISKNELECISNGSLANLVRQLSSLSKHAENIFSELYHDALKMEHKMESIDQRIKRIGDRVSRLDPNAETGGNDFAPKQHFEASYLIDQQSVDRHTLPSALAEFYSKCERPPDLERFTRFREDGKSGLKMYTDPQYFFELWRQEILKEMKENEEKHKSKQGQRHRVPGERKRPNRLIRPPQDHKQQYIQHAIASGEYIHCPPSDYASSNVVDTYRAPQIAQQQHSHPSGGHVPYAPGGVVYKQPVGAQQYQRQTSGPQQQQQGSMMPNGYPGGGLGRAAGGGVSHYAPSTSLASTGTPPSMIAQAVNSTPREQVEYAPIRRLPAATDTAYNARLQQQRQQLHYEGAHRLPQQPPSLQQGQPNGPHQYPLSQQQNYAPPSGGVGVAVPPPPSATIGTGAPITVDANPTSASTPSSGSSNSGSPRKNRPSQPPPAPPAAMQQELPQGMNGDMRREFKGMRIGSGAGPGSGTGPQPLSPPHNVIFSNVSSRESTASPDLPPPPTPNGGIPPSEFPPPPSDFYKSSPSPPLPPTPAAMGAPPAAKDSPDAPPPPAGKIPAPPPPPPLASSEPTPTTFMNGKRTVSPDQQQGDKKHLPPISDPRSDLLKSIREGIILKQVQQAEKNRKESTGPPDVASILRQRFQATRGSSPSSSEHEEEEWSD